MTFRPPSWVPEFDVNSIPDDTPVCDVVLTEKHGRLPFAKSRNPFTCGLTGKTYTYDETNARVDAVAAALGEEMGWSSTEGSEWDKVVGLFSLNTVRML